MVTVYQGMTVCICWNDILFLIMQVRVKIKVVTGTPSGAVAAEARWSGSHWVILDK